MKPSKVLLASMLALSASMAFAATTTVHITGSTAFRASTHNALVNILPSVEAGYVGSSLTGASRAVFKSTVGADTIIVQTSWSGSDAGIEAVANKTITRPVINNWPSVTNLTGAGGVYALTGTVTNDTATAEVALADNSQTESSKVPGATYEALLSDRVGVIPFVWAKGTHSNVSKQLRLDQLTNITALQARLLFGAGIDPAVPANNLDAPFSFFTNVSADDTYLVHVLGRDSGSGTRLNAILETGFGSFSTPLPKQYVAVRNGGGTEIASLTLQTNGLTGYSSGSTLVADLSLPVSTANDFFVVGYVSIADARSLPGVTFNTTTGVFGGAGAANILKYNGETFNYDAVREGRYSFWNYEYVLSLPVAGTPGATNTITTAQRDVVDDLVTEIFTNTADDSGILIDSDFRVERDGAGLVIKPL